MPRVTALPTHVVRALQAGGADAYGAAPEHAISDGHANPCRHCLRDIPKGADMLILAYRPFDSLHPYAETGPIFLCAESCTRGHGAQLPEILTTSPDYLIKGYALNDRIIYGTGAIVPSDDLTAYAEQVMQNPEVTYMHIRSARNNCYLARLDRD